MTDADVLEDTPCGVQLFESIKNAMCLPEFYRIFAAYLVCNAMRNKLKQFEKLEIKNEIIISLF